MFGPTTIGSGIDISTEASVAETPPASPASIPPGSAARPKDLQMQAYWSHLILAKQYVHFPKKEPLTI